MKDALKVGISGVRGVVGRSLTPQIVTSFAQAFGTFAGRGTIIVGRDTRPTGSILEHAVIAGLQSVGCKPLLAGVVPTPTVLYLTRKLRARGGICITASHNPVEWNALKFVGADGLFLGPVHAEELFDIYHQQDFPMVEEGDLRSSAPIDDPTNGHFDKVFNYVDAAAIRERAFTVAVDGCNGVGAEHSKAFLEALGCTVVMVHGESHGRFERKAEPTPESLTALSKAVIESGADIGFAQDPDGDRLTIVDEQGTALNEEMTLAMAVKQVIEHHDGAGKPIVLNLSVGKTIDAIAREHGSEIVRTRIGEIHVSSRMVELGSPIGGESNGGVIIPGIHPCRDSFGGMAIVLERLALTGKTPSALRAELPRFHMIRDKIRVRGDRAPALLRMLRKHYAAQEINTLDGVHIDFGDHWLHVRPSNTEPVMRVAVESVDAAHARSLCDELLALLDS